MRLSIHLIALILLCCTAHTAQAVDILSLGKPIEDDSLGMYERYVFTDREATSIKIPLDRPILSNSDVTDWVRQQVPDTLTLDGSNYTQKTTINKIFFTPKGYAEYISALEAASMPKLLMEKNYTLSTTMMIRPEILAQGLRPQPVDPQKKLPPSYIYVWILRMPVTLNYQRGAEKISYDVQLDIELQRTAIHSDDRKVAINSWKFSPIKPKEKPSEDDTTTPSGPSPFGAVSSPFGMYP